MVIKYIIICSVAYTFLTTSVHSAEPKLATLEKKAKWENLLKEGDLSQWKKLGKGQIMSAVGWSVKNGVLHLSKAKEVKGKGGSITTIKAYRDFEMKFEFKLSIAGNSGVKYRSLANLGFEFQILDDKRNKDNINPKNRMGSIYQLVAASDDKKMKPVGEWNTGRILAKGNRIEHWLNSEKVASLELESDDWKKRFADSKYKKFPAFGKQGGEILLQDHGNDVWFRNLLIRELK